MAWGANRIACDPDQFIQGQAVKGENWLCYWAEMVGLFRRHMGLVETGKKKQKNVTARLESGEETSKVGGGSRGGAY